jgi:HAD superfamily hydrolase (TIGR01509 family)
MNKLIIFDLDGVLIDSKEIHFETLNQALDPEYRISKEEHLSIYDGLKTSEKLKLLSYNKGLPEHSYSEIWDTKQKYTLEHLRKLEPSTFLKDCLSDLKSLGFKIAVCSNSVKKTVLLALSKLDIIEYFDLILSNEDVLNSKPHPEIYWKAMSSLSFLPENTLIVEDSPVGLLAANRSQCKIMRVNNPKDISLDKIMENIMEQNINYIPKWKDDNLNILIPMAGAGSRFEAAGYTFPKPLIEVHGKPMIQVVVENLNLDGNYIYIVQKSHREKYNLDTLLNLITPNCKIIDVDGLTEGAACTTLLAKELINNDMPLFFANSDQYVDWNSNEFMYKMSSTDVDGGMTTFMSTHPKWSYAKTDENGLITEVAEKNPISNLATVGFYYWKKGLDYVKYAEQMISKNVRVNNEFYVCPVFNEAISDGKKFRTFDVSKMWGLGTPEDLNLFLSKVQL